MSSNKQHDKKEFHERQKKFDELRKGSLFVANDTENFKKRHFWVIDKIKKSVLLVFELNDEGHQKIYSNSPVEIQEITISDINSINILK